MSLLYLVITLVVVGVLLWVINTYVPMDPKIKRALNIVVIVVVAIWLLKALGVIEFLREIKF